MIVADSSPLISLAIVDKVELIDIMIENDIRIGKKLYKHILKKCGKN